MIGLLVLGIITLTCLIGVIWSSLAIWRGFSSETWNSIEAEIIESKIDIRSGDGTSYIPAIKYKYSFEGSPFEGKRIKYGFMPYSKAIAYAKVEEYSKGSVVRILIDPKNPERSVVESGLSRATYFVFAFFLLISILGVLELIRIM
jgi:hypothetical protein